MPKRKRKRKSNQDSNVDLRTIIVKILIGSAVGIVLFFALTAIMSLIAWKSDMADSSYKYMILVAGAISGMICGFVSVRPLRKNGIIFGSLSCLATYLIIVIVATYFNHCGLGVTGWILLLIMAVFACVGGVVAVNKRK